MAHESGELNRTPFYPLHQELGARMVPFAGWEMPLQYTGILEEHRAVRERAGLFDVSHMGRFLVRGPRAFEFLNYLTTNDLGRIGRGQAQYTLLCHAEGGILDDLVIMRLEEEEFLVTVNAANREKDWAWMEAHTLDGVSIEDQTWAIGQLALQGPKTQEVLAPFTDLDLEQIEFYRFGQGKVLGKGAQISRTGYTGEDGFELYLSAEEGVEVARDLLEAGRPAGLIPCGLGARDTLRLEVKYCLYGNDISEETTPLEAGLGWVVKLEKGEFIGRQALLRQKEEGVKRRLIGFQLTERGVPRPGYPVYHDRTEVGTVASGTHSPSLGQGIGTAYVPKELSEAGTPLAVRVRSRDIPATVVKTPFYKDGSLKRGG